MYPTKVVHNGNHTANNQPADFNLYAAIFSATRKLIALLIKAQGNPGKFGAARVFENQDEEYFSPAMLSLLVMGM